MEWYARAVGALRPRRITDRTSWRYLGAIHGFDEDTSREQGLVSDQDTLPPPSERRTVFNQCQHQGWYFLPWHRGYLAAFEAILGKVIEDLNGPSDWGVPYWNYLDSSNPNARRIPQEFLDDTLPDGTPNPLSQVVRHGVTTLAPQPWFPTDISLTAQPAPTLTRYTAAAPGLPSYGGGSTGFSQFGGLTGANEGNPHNTVHVLVGGIPSGPPPVLGGWMTDPDLAALDPIFWVHHCNVDRLWAAWMTDPSHIQEIGPAWSAGPFPQQFTMPDPTGALQTFTPRETLPGGRLDPTYDDLIDGTGIAAPVILAGLNAPASVGGSVTPSPLNTALLAANAASLSVGSDEVATRVTLPATAQPATLAPAPQRVFLNLEAIRGTLPSGILDVRVIITAGTAVSEPELVDTLALFGLGKASRTDGAHAGAGVTVAIDITELVEKVETKAGAAVEAVDVRFNQPDGGETPITVERVSLYSAPAG